MPDKNLLWLTQRSEYHQKAAKRAAPPNLHVTVLRYPTFMELHDSLHDAHILVSERSMKITESFLSAAPHLEMILRLGSLIYDVDLDACRERGIVVCQQPVVGAMLVAEHLLLMTLALLRHLDSSRTALLDGHPETPLRTDEDTFSYNWTGLANVHSLYGKNVLIMGMGEIGVELARRLKPFQPRKTFYNKRYPYPGQVEAELGLEFASLEDSLPQTDVLINLLPYSAVTDYFVNSDVFSLLKPGAIFVHAGSGSTVDENALAEALLTRQVSGAALDTYEFEPLPLSNPLVKLAQQKLYNLILTPHIAAGTGRSDRAHDYAEIIRYLAGESLQHRVV